MANTPFVYNVKLDYGAVGDGVADDTTEIQAAVDAAAAAGGGIVFFPPGIYKTGQLALKTRVRLEGAGATLRKFTGAANTFIVNALGTLGTAQALSANANLNDPTVTVGATTGLAAGDFVVVRDNTYEFTSPYSGGRNQEINRILSISGTTITLSNRLIGSYATASTAEIVKLNAVVDAALVGLRLEVPAGVGGTQTRFEYSYGITVSDCVFVGPSSGDGGAVDFYRSAAGRVTRCKVIDGQNVSSSNNGYGYTARESSHHVVFDGNHSENVRENAFSDGAKFCSFINNTCLGSHDSGFNTHGAGCRHILIQGNIVTGSQSAGIRVGFSGAKAGDFDVQIIGNIVRGVRVNGILVEGGDQTGGTKNSKRVTVADNQVARFGQGTTAHGIVVIYSEDVEIHGNRVDGTGSTVGKGILVETQAKRVIVADNRVQNVTTASSVGIAVTGVGADRVQVLDNQLIQCTGNCVWISTNPTNVTLIGNMSDTDNELVQGTGTVARTRNIWAGTKDTNSGVTSVANGGTIAHGLTAAPTRYGLTPTAAGRQVAVTAVSATTLTISLTGAVGAENVAWWAEV